MTPRFLAQENKIRLLLVFLFVLLLFVAFRMFQSGILNKKSASKVVVPASVQINTRPLKTGKIGAPLPLDESHFMGLRHATSQEIQAAIPEASGKPVLLEFSSAMCHDCKRLKPVVSKILSQFPGVQFHGVDVIEDQATAAALLRTFKPVTVPVLVFIGADSEIKNVLYNYQSADVVQDALSQLQPAQTASK